jgi:hypothetical protein
MMLLMATMSPALAVEFLRAASELQLQPVGFQHQTAELQRQRRPVRVNKWPSGGTWGGKQKKKTPLSDRSLAAAADSVTSRHLHPEHPQLDSAYFMRKSTRT